MAGLALLTLARVAITAQRCSPRKQGLLWRNLANKPALRPGHDVFDRVSIVDLEVLPGHIPKMRSEHYIRDGLINQPADPNSSLLVA